MRPRQVWTLAAAASVLVLALVSSSTAAGKAQDVFVTNDGTAPVPTSIVGTPTVNVGGGSLTVDGTVNVGNDGSAPIPVNVQNTPAQREPWQKMVEMTIGPNSQFDIETFTVPVDRQITVERIGLSDLFGRHIRSLGAIEACDFSDGQSGFGGYTAVPLGAIRPDGNQAIDQMTLLHVTPGVCLQVAVVLAEAMGPNASLFFSVNLSGWQTPVPAVQGASVQQGLERSKQDPAYRSLMESLGLMPKQIDAIRP